MLKFANIQNYVKTYKCVYVRACVRACVRVCVCVCARMLFSEAFYFIFAGGNVYDREPFLKMTNY